MRVVEECADDAKNQNLTQGSLLIDWIHHLNVERGRFVKAARGVIEQNVGVLEEPGCDEQGEGNADEARLGGNEQQECKYNDYGYCATARGTD